MRSNVEHVSNFISPKNKCTFYLQTLDTCLCDALTSCDILGVPLSFWCSSVSRTHAQPWKKCRVSHCHCWSSECSGRSLERPCVRAPQRVREIDFERLEGQYLVLCQTGRRVASSKRIHPRLAFEVLFHLGGGLAAAQFVVVVALCVINGCARRSRARRWRSTMS